MPNLLNLTHTTPSRPEGITIISRPRRFRAALAGGRFAADSLLEGHGFEPSVPVAKELGCQNHRGLHGSPLEEGGFEPSVPRLR
jgi:hypothetical protein